MTWYLNLRHGSYGTAAQPYVLQGDGAQGVAGIRSTTLWELPAEAVRGADVLFAVHGFNVSYDSGVRGLARLEAQLNLGGMLFVGVLWPGDWWLPAINYPAEAADAVTCGRHLAAFVNRTLRRAGSVSFVSHSLGARVVLEALKNMDRQAREVCLTAPAVDDDCFKLQYMAARANARRTTVLASRRDKVLKVAYPIGDAVSDVAYDDGSAWRAALGLHGPRPSTPAAVAPTQIADGSGYDHGDYFPPSRGGEAAGKWTRSVAYMRAALRSEPVPAKASW